MAEKRVYRWYLILSIIYSSISILTGIIFYKPDLILPITIIWAPIIFLWFVFNIVMIIVFIKKKIEKIAFWLPGLYIFDDVFSTVVGFIVAIVAATNGIDATIIFRNPLVVSSALVFPVVTLILAIKLILRK